MALTDEEISEAALSMVEGTRKMIAGEGLGTARFHVSPDRAVASIVSTAVSPHDEDETRMAFMLIVAERRQTVDDAMRFFGTWVASQDLKLHRDTDHPQSDKG